MKTSTLPPTHADVRSQPEGVPVPELVPAPFAGSSIRMAGLSDIPAIALITQEGPQPVGIEPAVMSRATRLLLTHVAFEHGVLWVEQAGGSIVRAVTAIPAGQLPRRHTVLRHLNRQLGGPATGQMMAGFGQDLLAELTSVESCWLLVEISKASQNKLGDPALLGTALSWARLQSEPAGDPVLVLTDTLPERMAAQSLGFVERRTGGLSWPWWLGVAGPEASSPGS
jgi:hypothetical protein